MEEDKNAPADVPVREISMDVQRTREEMMIPAKWLVLFRGALLRVFDGMPHPTRLDSWIGQTERIVEAYPVLRNLWVRFAIIQLEGEASKW